MEQVQLCECLHNKFSREQKNKNVRLKLSWKKINLWNIQYIQYISGEKTDKHSFCMWRYLKSKNFLKTLPSRVLFKGRISWLIQQPRLIQSSSPAHSFFYTYTTGTIIWEPKIFRVVSIVLNSV